MGLSSSLSFWEESVCHCYFHFLVLLPFNFLPWFFRFMFNVLIFLSGLSDRNLDHYFCTLPFIVNKPSMLTPSPMGENTNDKIMKMQFYKEEMLRYSLHNSPIMWFFLSYQGSLCVFMCLHTCVLKQLRFSQTHLHHSHLPLASSMWVLGVGKLPEVTNAIFALRNLHLHVIRYCASLLVCSLSHLSSAVLVHYSYLITR